MPVELQIERMTLEEKLRAMEALWADLSRHEEQIPSPAWHQQILQDREKELIDFIYLHIFIDLMNQSL